MIDGQGYSRLVGGPSGVWLLYQKTYGGRAVRSAHRPRPACTAHRRRSRRTTSFNHAYYAIAEDSSGPPLTVGWFSSGNSLYVQSSADGHHWSAPQVIARNLNQPSYLSLSAAGDGGGFAAFQEPEPGGATGSQIDVAAFGSFAATGLKGLGNLDGDGIGGLGGDPLGSTSCTDVHFGDIDALAEAGCFLRDPSNPNSGAAITAGEIRLNGLEIIPEAGAEIVIDPRQHTINTTGSVRVVLRAPGIGDITLYEGELHLNLAGSLADAGRTLFDVDVSKITSALEGFPIRRHDRRADRARLGRDPDLADVAALHGRCHRPGHAVGQQCDRPGADLASHRDPDLSSAALEVKNVAIDYTENGYVVGRPRCDLHLSWLTYSGSCLGSGSYSW